MNATDQLRVLVVEDHPAVQNLLVRQLSNQGCDVHAVANVVDALLALDDGEWHLVLVDLTLEGDRDGWEIIERRRRATDPLVVVVSGSNRPDHVERAMAYGAPFLLKPTTTLEIATVIQEAERRRAISREGRRRRDPR